VFGGVLDNRTRSRLFDEEVERGEPLVRVERLEKHFGGGMFENPVRAVDDVSFEVRKGETLAVVGESGCGKTTLGRTLIGLESETGGTISSRGTDVTELSGRALREWQQDAQMVFQDPEESLDERMTIGEIIREPLDAHDWGTRAARRERVFGFLDKVGLQKEHYYRYPHQFSGGQRQRIGIARALILEPAFLVLDEPVSALDVSVQARIINLLDRLQRELELTYLFIAHDLSVVRHIADRVAVMYLGNIVEIGPTAKVFDTPTHPYTASLLSAIPGSITRGTVGEKRAQIKLRGSPPNPRDPPSGCPFSTRCPMKIRPDGIEASDAVWDAIDEFRVVLRERARKDTSVTSVVGRWLGVFSGDSVERAYNELFGDHELPAEIRKELQTATEIAASGRDAEAEAHLRESLGSACDRNCPDSVEVTQDQCSRCLRNEDENDPVRTALEQRESESAVSNPKGSR